MIPTPKLRFVIRYEPTPIRILQQWWEPEYNIIDMVIDKKTGEWRDVPLEEEQA